MSLPKEWLDMLSNTVESQVSNISAEVVMIETEGVEVVITQPSQECMEKAFVEEKKRGSKKTWGHSHSSKKSARLANDDDRSVMNKA